MTIKLKSETVQDIIPSIQRYVHEELDLEISGLEAKFLLEYFLAEAGPFVYNKGVSDAETYLRDRVADLPGVCFEEGLTYWVKNKKN